ncbi:MAG: NAD(P)-binding domain-containing protein [Bacteroidetes bacterium]|nr:NAD(P)-binding domain-containing protein [Bacteroidota bacterium]
MNNAKVLITGDFDIPLHHKSINVIHLRTPIDNNDIIKHLVGVQHYIIGGPEFINDTIMSQAPQLKHVVVLGTGTNSFIDLEAAKTRKIKVDNTPGINADAVAEFALGTIILNIANSFHSRDGLLTGGWYQKPHKMLSEIKLGIIGLGNIGTKLIEKVSSISPSSKILYFSRTRKEHLERKYNLTFIDLIELVQECDIIVLCLEYNKNSHYIINAKILDSAKKGLMLFNFSNPKVVNPKDLSQSLKSGVVDFAFFDGYYEEWINNKGQQFDKYGLLNLGSDKFIATSHIAALTISVILRELEEAFTKVRFWK